MIDRIDHFVLTVTDIGATLEFYERVLGFTPRLQEGPSDTMSYAAPLCMNAPCPRPRPQSGDF